MAFGDYPALVDSEDYGRLTCKCGNIDLHQDDITIFKRGEDGDITTVIAQNGNEVQTSKFPSADTCNPSPRRHGLIIEFDCEHCTVDGMNKQRLAIFQHKGGTFMEWL